MTTMPRALRYGFSTLAVALLLQAPIASAQMPGSPAPAAPNAAPNSNAMPASTVQVFTPEQQKALGSIIRNYLLENPEVLLQASAKLREKMQQQQTQQAMEAIQLNKAALFSNPTMPTYGNPNGTKLMVEFFDYQCPHCKSMGKVVNDLVMQNADLKVIFMELPIFGGASDLAAKAALAAQMQGKYMPLHTALLAADNPLTEDKIYALAKAQGLDVAKLKIDMQSQGVVTKLNAVRDLAEKLNLQGTPAFVISNSGQTVFKFVPGEASAQNLQGLLNQL